MPPAAIVFDLWYTLVCPEDQGMPRVRTIEAIPASLAAQADAGIDRIADLRALID